MAYKWRYTLASIFLYETLDEVDYKIMLVRMRRILFSMPEFVSLFGRQSVSWVSPPNQKIKKLIRFREEDLTVRIQVNLIRGQRNLFMVIDSPNGRDDIQIMNPRMTNPTARMIVDEANNEWKPLETFTPEQLKMEIRDFVADYME